MDKYMYFYNNAIFYTENYIIWFTTYVEFLVVSQNILDIVCLQKSRESKGKMCCVIMAYKQLVVNKAYLGYFIYILTCYLRTFFPSRIHIKLFG